MWVKIILLERQVRFYYTGTYLLTFVKNSTWKRKLYDSPEKILRTFFAP